MSGMETNTKTQTSEAGAEIAKTVWPALNYQDAPGAILFLTTAFGFETRINVADGDVVHHAELRWPEGGGVMLGSSGRADSEFSQKPSGAASVYVVTDQPDELFERSTAAGADVVRGLEDTDYGSRGFTVRDPEGNLWSFGTYRGT
jgi:uncharacterized glyoxalase superfamily protein PhnB